MKRFIFIILISANAIFYSCNGNQPKDSNKEYVVHLTNDDFKTKVFDYEKNKQWKYLGNKPAIIDFYANWCGPCRQLSPIIEEIAKEYNGKIIVYKVNTDVERILTNNLGITNLPTLIFIPLNEQPQATMGALPKETLVKIINEFLLKNNTK